MTTALKAPFPYAGGKSRVASVIWERLGNVSSFVDPFFGSGAILLGRPHAPKTETVNDADGLLCNAWRAMKYAPDEVAKYADWPVSEADLHARHYWLITEGKARLEGVLNSPEAYDAKVAGWWIWGACLWIGSGWCGGGGPWLPGENGEWIDRKLPLLGAGQGIHRQLPHLGDAGRGEKIAQYFSLLSSRLERVRIACGDWSRVMGECVTTRHGLTGVFLDPPYQDGKHSFEYSGGGGVFEDVWNWAVANGDNPLMRIAICGYDDGRQAPPAWTCHAWKAAGGYGSQGHGRGRENCKRERIWFSPSCLPPVQSDLFTPLDTAP